MEISTLQVDSQSRVTVDQIQQQILKRICIAQYKPGDQLKEAVLAKEFGVSRTPVRDAIARIGHLGLVETRNGVGTVVIELSDERVHHLYEMRLAMATLIGELSPIRIRQDHLIEARAVYAEAVALREQADSKGFVSLNQRLQSLIVSLVGNTVLREFWNQAYFQASSVWHRMEQTVGPEVYQSLVEETSDLLIALEQNDIAAVGYVQRIHIGYGYNLIQKHLLY